MRGSRASSRRYGALAAATLVALALISAVSAFSGCEANPEPPPLTSPSSSPSPTESPSATPTPPPLPPAAQGTSEAAAKAFVEHYFATLNYAIRTGDTEGLSALGTADCESCQAIASNIDRVYGAGGEIRSDGWLVQSVNAVPQQPKSAPAFDLGVTQSREEVVESPGAEPKVFEGGKQPMTIYLVRGSDGWQVKRLDRVA